MGRANEEAPPGSRSGASHRLRSKDAPASPRINPAPRDRFGHMRAKGSAGVSALYGGGGPRGGRASLCLDPHGPLRLSNDRGSARRPQMYLRNGHRVVLCAVDNRPAKPLPRNFVPPLTPGRQATIGTASGGMTGVGAVKSGSAADRPSATCRRPKFTFDPLT